MKSMGELFAGIGGFSLGFQRAGFDVKWQVEIDPYCRKVLAKNFPKAERFEDVRTSGAANLCSVDVICGGFPCQDISYAGFGAGIDGERSGLWREYARIISELRPRFAVVENVPALLTRGLGRVLGDLAAIGYDAEWSVISAADTGLPHLRERIWIVAYPTGERREEAWEFRYRQPQERFPCGSKTAVSSDAGQERIQGRIFQKVPRFSGISWCQDVRRAEDLRDRPDLPPPLFRGSRDGIPDWVDRISSCGNAVVPQIPEWIARRILEVPV